MSVEIDTGKRKYRLITTLRCIGTETAGFVREVWLRQGTTVVKIGFSWPDALRMDSLALPVLQDYRNVVQKTKKFKYRAGIAYTPPNT